MAEKQSLVERVNNEMDDLQQRAEGNGADAPELPKLDAKDEDSTYEEWYDNNVAPLVERLEEFKEELECRDGNHAKLTAKIEVVTDLLPSRNDG
jgi:hypothetical protein